MKTIENVVYTGGEAPQKLDVYLPDGETLGVFVYFHGGGIEKGDKKSAARFAPYLTDRGIAIASANYRMYPSAEYPEFIRDAAQAVAWTNNYMKENLNCDKFYVGGSSAGGYISMMLCFDKRYLAEVGLDNSAVTGYLHDAGQPTAHFNVLKHSGVDPRRVIVDERAPLYFVGMESAYPTMRFIVSDNDMKCRYEQTVLMLATLSHFGHRDFDHVVMSGKHCEYLNKFEENGDSVLAKMIYDFIKKQNEKGKDQ